MRIAFITFWIFALVANCSPFDDCEVLHTCETASTSTGGQGGTGGSVPCAGTVCEGDERLCQASTNTCLACVDNTDCPDATASRCAADNTCQPCMMNTDCDEVAGKGVCNAAASTCVECDGEDSSHCGTGETCSLVDLSCVPVLPNSVGTCGECSNDAQCIDDNGTVTHRCVPMEYPESVDHGSYCLKLESAGCEKPYSSLAERSSLNGEPAENYCIISENLTTCEAVRALEQDWTCTPDTMDKCFDANGDEMDVPGAICRKVGALNDRCTYACQAASECPSAASLNNCGENGTNTSSGWCGGGMN